MSRTVVVAIGINALGYGEVLGIAVRDSEAKGFWRQFLGSLKQRGLDGTRLVISDAHLGLTAAIQRMCQGCCWRRTHVVGIFPNDAAITRLVGGQLLEQQEEWPRGATPFLL